MRKSLSNHEEVAHIWAQQNQENGYAGHMTFHGPTLYSYGHYWIGHFATPEVALLRSDTYSVSTAQHISKAQRASQHKTQFTVPSQGNHNINTEFFMEEIKKNVIKISRARSNKIYWIDALVRQEKTLKDYLRLFDEKINTDTKQAALTLVTAPNHKALIEANREETARLRIIQAAQREAIEVKQAGNLERWKAGENLHGEYRYQGQTMALRLNREHRTIETTSHATVSLPDVIHLYRAIQARKPLHGLKVGQFTVTGVDEQAYAIKIGCHTIPLSEIPRIGPDVVAFAGFTEIVEKELQPA